MSAAIGQLPEGDVKRLRGPRGSGDCASASGASSSIVERARKRSTSWRFGLEAAPIGERRAQPRSWSQAASASGQSN